MTLLTRILERTCKIGIFLAVLVALVASAPLLLVYWIWLVTSSRRRPAWSAAVAEHTSHDLESYTYTHKPLRKTLLSL